MKLDNRTPYPAHLFRGVIEDRRMFGSVAVRVTYDVVGDRLRVAPDQPWIVSPGPWDSQYGPMASDELFYRGGVDVFVFGCARAHLGRPAPRVDVEVRVGPSFRRKLAVYGQRTWTRRGAALVPSSASPFRAIPLTLAYAYGGKGRWDGLDVPFSDNPDGRGFYLDEASAEDHLLPNIEDPASPIRRWDDRPEPVGVCALTMGFGPRLRRSLRFDDATGVLAELRPTFYNAAFPDMIVPKVEPGERVSITGVREDGPLVFHLPAPELRVRLAFGAESGEREPAIDQIGVEADHMRVFVSYRYPFRYHLNPLEKRSVELVAQR